MIRVAEPTNQPKPNLRSQYTGNVVSEMLLMHWWQPQTQSTTMMMMTIAGWLASLNCGSS
ncbi:hypothetical protein BLOT_015720 [Blomia tropicalis]|nr:hypothetical protein BLOT_015720 [Blomia tropicalis]